MNRLSHWGVHILCVVLLLAMYVVVLGIRNPSVFVYRFDPTLVDRYMCSQDIPTEPECKRLFLSDEQIHIAARYLYVSGEDPTVFNFQHPPFIKYLYGISILATGNPYWAQIVLGMIFLALTYSIGYKVFARVPTGFLACLFLLVDRLFISLSGSALLDLGQGAFLLLYFFSMMHLKPHYFVQGIVLGFLLTSKFWGGSLFFILAISAYLALTKQINLRGYIMHVIVAFIVFCIVYMRAFIERMGLFNIVFFELKTLKYWLHHSVSSSFGSALVLFLTGAIQTWWGNKAVARDATWSVAWPIAFVASCIQLVKAIVKGSFAINFLVAVVAVGYLVYLGVQAPYSRYFILVLPFFYMVCADVLTSVVVLFQKSHHHR